MYRKGEFGRDFWGSPSLPCKGLVELFVEGNEKRKLKVVAILGGTLLGFEDLYPTKLDVELIGKHKLKEAALQIACRLEGISFKTARRRKPRVVQ
jgi:hypothetical protein